LYHCDITTRTEYNIAKEDLRRYLKEYKDASDYQISKAMRGAVMVQIGVLKNISARGKLNDVFEYTTSVIEAGEKVVLFVHLKEVANELIRLFPNAVTVLGRDNSATRQRNIDKFQNDPRTNIIICSIKAAGVGITLTASSRVGLVELPWHSADAEQCEDRCNRIGAKFSTQVTYFLGENTIDQWLYGLIVMKRSLSRMITGDKTIIETNIITELIDILNN